MSSFRRFAAKNKLDDTLFSGQYIPKKSINEEFYRWCAQVEQILGEILADPSGRPGSYSVPDDFVEQYNDIQSAYMQGETPEETADWLAEMISTEGSIDQLGQNG